MIQHQSLTEKVIDGQQYMSHVLHPETGGVCTYKKTLSKVVLGKSADTWVTGLANEFIRLIDGVGERMSEGTRAIKFIPRVVVPQGKKVTYGNIVCDIQPHKAEVHIVRLKVMGDKIEYPGDVSTSKSDLTTTKCLMNSILSTPNAKGLCADVKDFYLYTEMKRFEYMKVKLKIFQEEIIDQHELTSIDHDGWMYIEKRKGMYALPLEYWQMIN